MAPMRIGIVGCGTISAAYLRNLTGSPEVTVVACADLVLERAKERAAEFGVPRACSPEELLSDPEVELVVNLTIAAAHAEVTLAALDAGKHVHSEKPLATNRKDGQSIVGAARERGLTVSCAPDTFLGAGLQTCLSLLVSGEVGEPLAASAFMLNAGPATWHPNPAFFYGPDAGPLLDMGPYYVTALVSMLGPVTRVTGMSRILYPEVPIGRRSAPGLTIKVTTPTYVAGLLEFREGAQAVLVNSFGIAGHGLPPIQVYCSEAIIDVPDPNTFGGPVRVRPNGADSTWKDVPLVHRHDEPRRDLRGIGLVDAVRAIHAGSMPRASGDLAYHVLDVMLSILESNETARHVTVSSTFERPSLLSLDEDLVGSR
jgi:predicted dehydrogenase